MSAGAGFLEFSGFDDLPDDEWQTAEQSAELVLRIAAGDADPLNGRFLHVKDDLDDLLAEAAAGHGSGRLRLEAGRWGLAGRAGRRGAARELVCASQMSGGA